MDNVRNLLAFIAVGVTVQGPLTDGTPDVATNGRWGLGTHQGR